jgi:hypothetical protein
MVKSAGRASAPMSAMKYNGETAIAKKLVTTTRATEMMYRVPRIIVFSTPLI